MRLVAAAYDYRITDLIERYAAQPTLFLYRNRGAADLRGVEVEVQTALAHGLTLELTAQASRGRDAGDGTPLDDVAPTAGSVTLRHRIGARVASYFRVKAAGSHRAAGPSEVPTRRYTLADAGVSWHATRHLEVRATMRNLLNEAYQSSAGPRWVFAPGRSGAVTVVLGWGQVVN